MEDPYQDIKQIMRSLCDEAGVRYFRLHAMRHAGASILDNANTPITAIQEILGHENRTTTEICPHSLSEAAQQAITA